MRNYLNKKISGWKGHHYAIDSGIPTGYLLRMGIGRITMLMRGALSGINHKGRLFFSWKATVRCRSKLYTGHSVTIARGAFVNALSSEGIHLGNNVSVGMNTNITGTGHLQNLGKGMKIGDNVGLGTHSFYGCGGGITIGSDTIVGDFVSMHAENHQFNNPEVPIRLQGVERTGITIGNNCWIGAKATILDGATIGDGCVIAAGAVVIAGNYVSNTIYAGVPAKAVGTRATHHNKSMYETVH